MEGSKYTCNTHLKCPTEPQNKVPKVICKYGRDGMRKRGILWEEQYKITPSSVVCRVARCFGKHNTYTSTCTSTKTLALQGMSLIIGRPSLS